MLRSAFTSVDRLKYIYSPKRYCSFIKGSAWDTKAWNEVKLEPASISLEMGSPTTVNVRLKKLSNKKKLTDALWHQEKHRIPAVVEEILNSVPNSSHDKSQGTWDICLQYHDEVVKVFKKCGARVGPVPKSVAHIFGLKMFLPKVNPNKQFIIKHAESNLAKLPENLENSLFPFQKEGIDFAVRQGGRCLIGDEMGLGKTLQAIAISALYKEDWPVLVICPSSVRMSWANEYMKWIGVDENDIRIMLKGNQALDGKINIISYDLTSKVIEEQQQFGVVIIDESHFIKNRSAKRTQSVGRITCSAKRVIMLSGTPALSRPEELYNQFTFLQPLIFPTFHTFAYRYCAAYKSRFGWDFSGSSHSNELNLLMRETMMIRRRKDDVLKELPPKHRNTVLIEAKQSSELKASLKKLKKQVSKEEKAGSDMWKDKRTRDLLITSLYRETCKSKLLSVQNFIETFIECTDEKIIIFAHHHAMLDAVQSKVEELDIQHIRIDGSVPPGARFQYVDEFQDDPKCRIAIISITAGGTGVTLNAASKVIFAELYWTPSLLLQAEDRAHRIGQVNHVSVYYLIAENTLDPMLWNMVKKKIIVVTKALDGEIHEFTSLPITTDDISHIHESDENLNLPEEISSALLHEIKNKIE